MIFDWFSSGFFDKLNRSHFNEIFLRRGSMRSMRLFGLIVIAASLFFACGRSPVEEEVPYMIFSKNSTLCLDVPGAQTGRGVQIILWRASDPDNPAPHHVWYFRKAPGGYKIFSRHSNLCLNVSGGSYNNNGAVIQWTDSGEEADNEIWEISGKDDEGYTITSIRSEKRLSAQDLDAHHGAKLVQHEYVDAARADAQTWIFKKLQ
ncbi:MAG: RICIN domain-containing protein [Spirochaetota bacterium]|nr:RICIN domain-containing protein [Spirochaetota bacterium]